MVILMPTCDKYRFLVKYNLYFLNKYWKDHPEVVVFGYEGDGFAGKDLGWVANLKNVLDTVEDEYVCLVQDDVVLVNEVNSEYMNNDIVPYMRDNGANFCYLLGWQDRSDNVVHTVPHDEGYRKIIPSSPYTIGTHPGVWKRLYMQSVVDLCLKNEINTPWEFEMKGSSLVSKNNLCTSNFQIKRGYKSPENSMWEGTGLAHNPMMFTFGGIIHGKKIKEIVMCKLKMFEQKLTGEDHDMFCLLKKELKSNFGIDF